MRLPRHSRERDRKIRHAGLLDLLIAALASPVAIGDDRGDKDAAKRQEEWARENAKEQEERARNSEKAHEETAKQQDEQAREP